MSGGPVTPIRATFLSRSGGSISENTKVPVLSRLNFSTDVRQFAGAFDFEVELGQNDSFNVQSHDFVEFWFQANGRKHQIGVGFVEDFLEHDSPGSSVISANGREFTGQLIQIPFRKQIQGSLAYESFIRKGIDQSYIGKYASFRGLPDSLNRVNSYAGRITAVTLQSMMAGALIQQYADLVLNVAYQNRMGQLEVYGRGTDASTLNLTNSMGTLCKGFGQTNVVDVSVRQNFSKVFSECTVFWQASQASVDSGSPTLSSQRFMNSDSRVAHIYQPCMKVFSSDDLKDLAAGISATQRVAQVAQSEIRKSMQNVNLVTVTTAYPYYVPPASQSDAELPAQPGVPFEVQQLWRIRSDRWNLDQIMRLVGIHYAQDPNGLEVQLAFVEPDTLI